jgi:hypothetical protein
MAGGKIESWCTLPHAHDMRSCRTHRTACGGSLVNDAKSDTVRLKSLLQPTDRLSISRVLNAPRTVGANVRVNF